MTRKVLDPGVWRHFDVVQNESTVTVTFHRPEKMNAFTVETCVDLRDFIRELPSFPGIRVLILQGRGLAFSAGGDFDSVIGNALASRQDERLAFMHMTAELIVAMRESPVVIIAAVNGVAAAAGASVALAADLRIVSNSASFAFLFAKAGLAGADLGATYLLPRLIGAGNAMKLLLLSQTIDAYQAERLGLATELVESDQLEGRALAMAQELASGAFFALSRTKVLVNRELDLDLSSALALESATQALVMGSDDFAEFHEAKKTGRQPEWKGY